jgi:hypothetical protein
MLAICFKSPPWNVQHMTGIVNSGFIYFLLTLNGLSAGFTSLTRAKRHLGSFSGFRFEARDESRTVKHAQGSSR